MRTAGWKAALDTKKMKAGQVVSTMSHVVVIEDQRRLQNTLRRGLEEEGYEVVSALTGPQTYDDQVKRYFAAKYVQGREGFVGSEAQPTFKAVTLMSAAAEQQRFVEGYRGSNPLSPQVVFKGATSRVAVKSISMLATNACHSTDAAAKNLLPCEIALAEHAHAPRRRLPVEAQPTLGGAVVDAVAAARAHAESAAEP